jgi:hypothetical protein
MALLYWEKFKKARKGAGKSTTFCLWGLQQLLHKVKAPSLQIRRIRTMALETFKIVSKIAPVCLQNLVSVNNSKYSFRYVNVLDVPRVKSTHYGKKNLSNLLPQHYGTAFRTISGLKIVFHILKVWSSAGVVRNVAEILLADNTFVLAAFQLFFLFVAIGLLLLYIYVWFLHESHFNFKLHMYMFLYSVKSSSELVLYIWYYAESKYFFLILSYSYLYIYIYVYMYAYVWICPFMCLYMHVHMYPNLNIQKNILTTS